MMDVLKQLEPQTTSSIHCLMTTEALEDPFIAALAQVLPQNSTLTTYPLRNSYVEPYEFVVQSSLKPFGNRLDELVYATFKMNEALQQKRDRVKLGFYGNLKTTVQLDFESTHPTYDSQTTARFQMVKVLSEDDPNEHVWEVSKYQGDILVDTSVVSSFASSKMLCSQSRRGKCRVICRKCIQESHHYLSEVPLKTIVVPSCGHALSCTCVDFNTRYSCEHFHIVSLCKDMLADHSEISFKSSKHNYEVRIVNGIASYDKEASVDQDRDDGVKTAYEGLKAVGNTPNQLKTILDSSNTISNTVENIVAAFSSELDASKDEKLNLKQCSVKLERSKSISDNMAKSFLNASPVQSTKTSQLEYDDLRNAAIKRLSGLLATLKKSKKATAKNRSTCQNVIDFVDNNCPSIRSQDKKTPSFQQPASVSEEEEELFSSAVNTGFQEKYNKKHTINQREKETAKNHTFKEITPIAHRNRENSNVSKLHANTSQSSESIGDNDDEMSPKKYSILSSERTKSSIGTYEPWDYGTMLSYFVKEKEPRWRYQIIGHNSPRYNLLRYI